MRCICHRSASKQPLDGRRVNSERSADPDYLELPVVDHGVDTSRGQAKGAGNLVDS